MADDKSVPMNYYAMFDVINQHIPRDCLVISEGANTMDISRTMIPNFKPKHRYTERAIQFRYIAETSPCSCTVYS